MEKTSSRIKCGVEKNTPNLIRLYFKRDHKKQKRIQCGITYKDFFSYFIPKYEIKEL